MQVKVARLDDLAEGRPAVFTAAGREIVLVRWRGDVYALRNVCPHMSESFAAGFLRERITSCVVGGATLDREMVIVCPWHGWEYSVRTGRSPTDPRLRVRSYAVSVKDGEVIVEMGAATQTGERSMDVGPKDRAATGTAS